MLCEPSEPNIAYPSLPEAMNASDNGTDYVSFRN